MSKAFIPNNQKNSCLLKVEKVFLHPLFSEFIVNYWRGAGVVTEQIANLSTGNCRLGSSPSLSARVS